MKNILNALFFALLANTIHAETRSSIYVELGQDEDNGDSQYFDADIAAGKKQILFGASNSTSGLDNSQSKSLYAGLSSDPLADTVVEFTLSQTDAENNYEYTGARLDLIFNSDNWVLGLAPEIRDVTIHYTANYSANNFGSGLGVSLDYYGMEPFFFSLGYTRFDYEDTTVTVNINRRFFNYSNTFNLENGLDESRLQLGTGMNFNHGKIGIKHQTSHSTDNFTYSSNSLYASYQFNTHWSSKLTLGKSEDDTTNVRFSSINIGYRW